MERKKGFDAKWLTARIALGVLIVAISLGLAGCGEQLARLEQNQLELQKLVQINAQQMTSNMKRIEDSHSELQVAIADVQDSTNKKAADIIAALEQNQLGLQEFVQTNTGQITSNMKRIQDSQSKLHVAIEDVQDRTDKKAADIIGTIEQEQTMLQHILQKNNQQLTNSIARLEQNQHGMQSELDSLHTNIQRIDESTAGLQQNLLGLQESLQNNTRDLANIIDVVGQKRLKFEERIQSDIRAMAAIVKAIQQSQAKLQEQIAAMQNNTQVTDNNLITAFEQLRATPSQTDSQISSTATEKIESSITEIDQ